MTSWLDRQDVVVCVLDEDAYLGADLDAEELMLGKPESLEVIEELAA